MPKKEITGISVDNNIAATQRKSTKDYTLILRESGLCVLIN